ncbi:MAG: sulfatase [Planctomycetia bacterium]|nr:sulfatase [Planctomycetia bacterium]
MQVAVVALAVLFAGALSPATAGVIERPNILWLVAEDMGPELACYGAAQVHTPTIDRLARGGVRFTRAFTTAPVCSASRSAFITGMYQTAIGAHNHRSHREDDFPLPDGVRIISQWMHDAGYFTANVRQFSEGVDFQGTGKTDWNFRVSGEPFDSDKWADLKTHQPFYAQVNFQESHRPFRAPKQADPALVAIPPYYPDHPVTRADWAAYLDAVSEADRKIGVVLEQLKRDGLDDSTVVVFFADHGQCHVRGKQFCYDEGLHIPLVIRWPKDFPPPRGFAPGTVDDRLVESLDITATSLDWAGIAKPPAMQGRVLFGARREPDREYAFGARDRCDETVFRFRTARDKQYRYIRNFTPERPFLSSNRYKENSYPVWNLIKELHAQGKLDAVQDVLAQPTMPAEELYDVAADRHEIHNLADSPEHRAVLDRFRGVLDRWVEETHDQGRAFEPPEVIEKVKREADQRGKGPAAKAAQAK